MNICRANLDLPVLPASCSVSHLTSYQPIALLQALLFEAELTRRSLPAEPLSNSLPSPARSKFFPAYGWMGWHNSWVRCKIKPPAILISRLPLDKQAVCPMWHYPPPTVPPSLCVLAELFSSLAQTILWQYDALLFEACLRSFIRLKLQPKLEQRHHHA